jgi:hypothetical protein
MKIKDIRVVRGEFTSQREPVSPGPARIVGQPCRSG